MAGASRGPSPASPRDSAPSAASTFSSWRNKKPGPEPGLERRAIVAYFVTSMGRAGGVVRSGSTASGAPVCGFTVAPTPRRDFIR